MVDGESSTLLVSQRLQRLRQYSSNFRNGIFDHEDLTAHPEYVRQFSNLEWNMSMRADGSTLVLYGDTVHSKSFLSVFVQGSAQAGIQSRRWLMPVGTPGDRNRWINSWAIDRAQDLLVTAELVATETHVGRSCEIRFSSLEGSMTTRMDHPAATLPCVQVVHPATSDATVHLHIVSLSISACSVVLVLSIGNLQGWDYSIEVYSWRTGQMVMRLELGIELPDVMTLADSYLLIMFQSSESPWHLSIYSLSPAVPNRPLCTLQLPDLNLSPGEHLVSHQMCTSQDAPAPEGHFRADPSQCMVTHTRYIRGPDGREQASHLLIPYATLLAHIHPAVSTRPDDNSADPPAPEGPPAPVPWQDWGPHGCLRLRPRPQHGNVRQISLVPSGSRMPVVGFDGPHASVYMFDVGPLRVAARTRRDRDDPRSATAIVEDVEAALPGVVDPGCAAIPYVVYRFGLPHPPWDHGAIRAVRMSMTGFTVTIDGGGFKQKEHTWTV